MKFRIIILAMLVGLITNGCSQYRVNQPLETGNFKAGYRFENMAMNEGNSDETFIILALSGGGTRAASFAYGAMQALEDARVPDGNSTLLDEVDIISSVSGGSFAAAYYALHKKKKFFDEFQKDVLHRKIERDLLLRIFLVPWNWWHLASSEFGRSDLADRYYGKYIFSNTSFKDLPRKRPFVVMNSTDIGIGARFSFIQEHFDRLCSDLDQVRISRAVTASSAFPVAFTPLTLKNYPSDTCGYETPDWISRAKKDLELNASRYERALDWESYEDKRREYIHLSDGGISDNLGLRGPVLGLTWHLSPMSIVNKLFKTKGKGRIKRVVIIAIDAQPKKFGNMDSSAEPPGIFSVLDAATSTPMEHYSTETIKGVRSFIENINTDFKDAGEDNPIGFYFSRVTFEAEQDEKIRRELQETGTRLQLPDEKVALLIEAGKRLLKQSPDFQRLSRDLGVLQ